MNWVLIICIIVLLYIAYRVSTINVKYTYMDYDTGSKQENFNGDVEKLRSNVDNVQYNIQKGLPDRQEAADRLAAINNTIKKFIRRLKYDYPDNEAVQRLVKRYNPDNIYEGTPLNGKNETSFSVDKGKELTICLRDKRNPSEFHDKNLVLYVIVHELAHIASKSYGHNAEFNKNFKWLLKEAIRYKIYKFEDYFIQPRQYCGMTISSTIL